MKLPRRSVLKALGAFASLPIGKMLASSVAQAQGMPPPLKFIGVYHPHGIAAEAYARRPTETETQFDLNFTDSALAPLASFKNRLITFEGVDLAVAELSGVSGHGAAVSLFTGSMGAGTDHNAQGPSLDQYLARTRGLGTTPFPTLNLGVGSSGDANQDAIAHGPGGSVIRNQLDPQVVWDQIFSTLGATIDTTAADAARRRGQSVIDFVRGDLNSLSGRLAAQEKLKLDQHLSALRDIESRLTTVRPVATCTVPARPLKTGNADPSLDFPRTNKYNGGEPYFDRIADLQIDLLAQAMLCDQTRFATLFFDDPGKITTVDGVTLPRDVHNQVAHTYSSASATSQVSLGRLNRYYYAKLARLMQKLADAGLLDSTVILAGSDMGNPSAHSTRNVPLVLAGGANGQLAMGRRLKATGTSLVPHNQVLVSVAKLFGDQSNVFGVATDPALITGGYPGL